MVSIYMIPCGIGAGTGPTVISTSGYTTWSFIRRRRVLQTDGPCVEDDQSSVRLRCSGPQTRSGPNPRGLASSAAKHSY
ncbi:uncharacterized protein K444DRAFT_106652 [Hyaloscypha bicolor E]|uniref:Uncharacterized protein n=1 Tax=Hyaloscypha bicolor E TaxID=1095630 RepID=A0A2J6SUU7_9HELO|nr:uncharacterized protein K444DRAFT_106652 [Hyaloscypha bicolor E]PMD54547.1 hypothetical protein K444DRAFT_106652 [Hyaloscypha bicolor E]